jgi:hypothetical protein
MGEGSEGIAANGDSENTLGPREAHDVSSRPEEDRGVSTGEMGEAEGGAEEGGVADQHTEDASLRRNQHTVPNVTFRIRSTHRRL